MTRNARPNLTSLSISCLSPESWDKPYHFACDLIVSTLSTLKTLVLGFETDILQVYPGEMIASYSQVGGILSQECLKIIRTIYDYIERRDSTRRLTMTYAMETLRFTGFDLMAFLLHPDDPFIDLSKLTTLRLESCSGLENALGHFTATLSLPCLKSFTIRTE